MQLYFTQDDSSFEQLPFEWSCPGGTFTMDRQTIILLTIAHVTLEAPMTVMRCRRRFVRGGREMEHESS